MLGIWLLWLNSQLVKRRRELIEYGRSVMAEIVGIVENYQIMVNNPPPKEMGERIA